MVGKDCFQISRHLENSFLSNLAYHFETVISRKRIPLQRYRNQSAVGAFQND